MKILVGTQNPGKIQAIKDAFSKYFDNIEIEGIKVESGVNPQPFDNEIYIGAKNRVNNLKKYTKKNNINADFYVSAEAGITNLLGDYVNINLVYIENKNNEASMGTSQGFPIPHRYLKDIKEKSLGTVLDEIFDENKLSDGKGGISILTKNEISRIDLVRDACILALTKYINDNLWK